MTLVDMLMDYRKNKSAEMAMAICDYLLSLYAIELEEADE